MADGSRLALKYYPSQAIDRRDRLGQEYEALSFLAQHNVELTPRPIRAGIATRVARCTNGSTATPRVLQPQPDDVDQLARFPGRTAKAARRRRRRGVCAAASAGIFSPTEAIAQVRTATGSVARCRRLTHPGLARVPRPPIWAPSAALARRRVEAALREAAASIPRCRAGARTQRALSPSDFGLHNAMRGEDGRLRFIDFEYFGWDDPVKLVSDTALHPGQQFSARIARGG